MKKQVQIPNRPTLEDRLKSVEEKLVELEKAIEQLSVSTSRVIHTYREEVVGIKNLVGQERREINTRRQNARKCFKSE